MTTKYTMAAIGLLFVIAAGAATVTAQSGYDLFQKALAAERADGNLQQAIQLYSRVVKEFGRDRSLAAKALLRMAECFEKLGDTEASALYERVVREYADQPDAVSIARARVNQRLVRPARGERVVWGPGREVDLFGTISPDGRYLTYVDWFGAYNVVLRDLQTGMDRPLTPNVSAFQYGEGGFSVISRTGDQVAYNWWPSSEIGDELRIAGLDGQGVPAFRLLLSGKGDAIRPFDWSPDGNWIALLIGREDRSSQIAVVNTRSGDLRVLKSIDWRGTGKIVFSPDSRYIAYDLLEGEGIRTQRVLVMAVDGSREVAITSDQWKNHVMGWAADGRLLFASDRSGTMALWAVRVEDGRPAGAPTVVKAEIASAWSLGLTRNGALYTWKIAGAMYVSTAPIDLAKGELGRPSEATHFVESRGQPAWSADGKDLLYVSCGPTGAGPCRVLLRSEQTGLSREVPHRLGYAYWPRLSPDGSAILT
ncbi:MAG: tetratricopeptide repeat protein, partial [Vicinamibacterales bacterium]